MVGKIFDISTVDVDNLMIMAEADVLNNLTNTVAVEKVP